MTRKIRTILFLSLLFLFIILAPSIVFYSWGYRFNFETKQIVKTGAFYFKVLPKSAQIRISPLNNKGQIIKDKEVTKKTDFFFGATLIENLMPQKYEIEITKDGFYSWKKNLEIKGNEVVEAKNVVLIPQDASINVITQNVENFFPSPDEKIIILKEKSGTTTVSADWSLKIFDVQNNVKSQLMDSKDIAKTGNIELLDLKFSSDGKMVILNVSQNEQLKYYSLDLNITPVKPVSLDFIGNVAEFYFGGEATETNLFYFNSRDNRKIFILKEGEIFEADLDTKKISEPKLENIRAFKISDNDFYYLENNGIFSKTDFSFSSQTKMNSQPFPLQNETEYQIYALSGWIFLKQSQKLYFLNPDSKSFEKFSDSAKEIKISPDLKKAAYFSDNEIWILFLEPESGQPQKEKGAKVFIARFSEKVEQVFWLTSSYLIFNNAAKIKVAEIDDRDTVNIIDLAEFNAPKIFWNQAYKKLFILSANDFYASKTLLP